MSAPEQRPWAFPIVALPLGLLLFVLVAFGVVRIALAHWDTEKVVVVAKSAAPGQYLQQADLETAEVDGYAVDGGAVFRNEDDAVGHLALGALEEGATLSKAGITAVAAPPEVATMLSLRFRTEDVTISDVKTGQRVHLLFAPLGPTGAPQAQAIEAILLAHPKDGEDGVVWVAIAAADRDALLNRLARSRLIVAAAP